MGMDRYKLMTYQRINYVIHLIIRIKDEKLTAYFDLLCSLFGNYVKIFLLTVPVTGRLSPCLLW